MSLAYIRKAYGLDVKRGGRIRYTGDGRDEFGTIIGASGAHLNIRLDGVRHGMPFHPTWKLELLPAESRVEVAVAQQRAPAAPATDEPKSSPTPSGTAHDASSLGDEE